MSTVDLSTIAQPLNAFISRLGLRPSDWVRYEDTSQISHTFEIPNKAALGLTPSDLNSVKQAYGSALTSFTFIDSPETGALPLLEINEQIDDTRLQQFRADIKGIDPIYLDFVLEKAKLVEQLIPSVPAHCHILLYFFPEALIDFLSHRFDGLEDALWPTNDPCKTILLVPPYKVALDGPYLAVIGEGHLNTLANFIPADPPDVTTTKGMYDYCRDHIFWRKDWVDRLTPLHFDVNSLDAGDGKIVQLLRIHLATLTILYTAQQTVEDKNHLVSTYVGSKYLAKVIIPTVAEASSTPLRQNNAHLLGIVNAVYNPVWGDKGPDPLPLVQSVVSERLQATHPEDAFEVIISTSETLESLIEREWQSILEDKLTAYFSQVKTLEEHIGTTVSSISQQITDMIKGVSDTMLATVGAIIGSFVVALFKDKFNGALFATGLVIYAIYVLAFPLIYNMWGRWGNYAALTNDYQKRRDNFKDHIANDRISEIEGTRIQDRKESFVRWFRATVMTYIVIAFLVLLAAFSALDPKGLISSITASSTSTPIPTALPTPARTPLAVPTPSPALFPTQTPTHTYLPTRTSSAMC